MTKKLIPSAQTGNVKFGIVSPIEYICAWSDTVKSRNDKYFFIIISSSKSNHHPANKKPHECGGK